MVIAQHPRNLPADAAAAIHDASERLGMLWVTSYSGGLGHRVSPSQLRALLAIARHEATNLTDLATDLDAMLSSASRLCDRLVAAGLIERRPGTDDRREVALRLTPDGHRLLGAVEQERRSALADVLASMDLDDQAALLRGLDAFSAAAPQPGRETRDAPPAQRRHRL